MGGFFAQIQTLQFTSAGLLVYELLFSRPKSAFSRFGCERGRFEPLCAALSDYLPLTLLVCCLCPLARGLVCGRGVRGCGGTLSANMFSILVRPRCSVSCAAPSTSSSGSTLPPL